MAPAITILVLNFLSKRILVLNSKLCIATWSAVNFLFVSRHF
jgi:hypothetical protein